MGVLAIWRYPVKAMLGQRLEAARLGAAGVEGDRRFVVRDRRTGERIASKRGRRDARLRACRAELAAPPGLAALRVTLPDGTVAVSGNVEDALGALLETDVEFVEASDGPATLGTPAMHHDFAAVHLVVTGTLRHLRALAPGSDGDPRRRRPNLVLDDGPAPSGLPAFAEDALIARELRGASGLRLRVGVSTPRCVVPTRASEELPADPGLLRTAARHHMVGLGAYGRGASVGAYADVPAAGTVAGGERLEVA